MAYHNRAFCHAQRKEHEETIGDESKALERDPEFLEAYLGRVRAELAIGRLEPDVADLDRLVQSDGSNLQ